MIKAGLEKNWEKTGQKKVLHPKKKFIF